MGVLLNGSLSSWRAWIEIRKLWPSSCADSCRSPHGERGLKYDAGLEGPQVDVVALLMESVD